jgi:hypothetical protein
MISNEDVKELIEDLIQDQAKYANVVRGMKQSRGRLRCQAWFFELESALSHSVEGMLNALDLTTI